MPLFKENVLVSLFKKNFLVPLFKKNYLVPLFKKNFLVPLFKTNFFMPLIKKNFYVPLLFFFKSFFSSGVGFPLFPEIFYIISQWSCSASESLWEMLDLNPGPLPQKSGALPMSHHISTNEPPHLQHWFIYFFIFFFKGKFLVPLI